jgi:hypothetical protein
VAEIDEKQVFRKKKAQKVKARRQEARRAALRTFTEQLIASTVDAQRASGSVRQSLRIAPDLVVWVQPTTTNLLCQEKI